MRESRKSCAVRLQEEGKHAVSMEIVVEDSKRCIIVAMRKRLKAVREEKLITQKAFDSILSRSTI